MAAFAPHERTPQDMPASWDETGADEDDAALPAPGIAFQARGVSPSSRAIAPQTHGMASRTPPEPVLSAAPAASAQALDDPFSISDHAPRASGGIEPTWRETQDDADADAAQQDDGAQPIFGESRRSQPEAQPALPDFLEAPGSRFSGWRFWFWTVLSLAGLGLLLAQAAVIYRVQIASQVPSSRPLLETLCASWGCQVEYPRHLDQISILGSALRVQPNAGKADDDASRLALHLTLRNNDARPQQWPVLMLDLTDFSGAVVVRKHLAPGDYLPAALARQPFAAKTDTAVRVPISVKGVEVNGYQLKPFFP